MARKDLSQRDASERERSSLEYILKKDSTADDTTEYVSVIDALHEEALYEATSSREETRVLFISTDETLLNPTLQTLDGYTDVSDLFDEVHILTLRTGVATKHPVARVSQNVWLYTATSAFWWLTPWRGIQLAMREFVFADGFRPDLIVARDPFESAVVALRLGKKYKRPVQIHVLENYTTPDFVTQVEGNRWRRHLPRFTIPRVKSVRTATKAMYDFLAKTFTVKDLGVLPKLNTYESMIDAPATINLRDKYKPFVFIMLYMGKLGYDSLLFRALDAARFGLRNPHLGLIVLGEGPARKEFEKRAELLGIRQQVVFEPNIKDAVPYLKSANVLLVPDITPESDEVVLQGAAAGIPLIMARNPVREDIFMDGESALLCDPSSTDDFSVKLNVLMNDVMLRQHLVEAAQAMIRAKFHEDPLAYKTAYRESIEQVLFADDEPAPEAETIPEPAETTA